MEIAKDAAASGGCSIRDLPPSKRFKFVGSHLGSAPCLPQPAKKRAFPPPLAKKRVLPPMPETARVSVCLPAKKRAYAPVVAEDAAKVCLPVKKSVYAAPPDAIVQACLPAKKRVHMPLSPPEDAATPPSIPAKKRVHPPQPQPEGVAAPPSVPAKKRVHPPQPPAEDAAAPSSIPAKKRVHPLTPPEGTAAPPSIPAKKRAQAPPPSEDAVASPSIPAKKRAQAPSPPEDAAALVPVCLPVNKRVMPPFISPPPSPSMESDRARVAAVKDARTPGSNKRGGATDSRVANGVGDCSRAEASKMTDKPIKPKEVDEQLSMKSRSANTARESKDLQCKKPRNAVNGKQSEVQVEKLKKFDEAIDHREVAPAREEPMKEGEEVAREQEQDAMEEDEDDGVLCAVCRSTDGDPLDPIVFCDGCDLMVHASCYGNPLAQSIPDGDWFCSLCSDKATAAKPAKKGRPPARPCCRLCPARGGAMKRTTEGAWAHIACALLVPEVFFRDPDGRDGIDCSRVPGHRFTKECYICESSRGCALECSQPKCGLGFHVSCGLAGGLCIEYREAKGGAVVAGFCGEHTKLWEKQQLTGKYKIVSRGNE